MDGRRRTAHGPKWLLAAAIQSQGVLLGSIIFNRFWCCPPFEVFGRLRNCSRTPAPWHDRWGCLRTVRQRITAYLAGPRHTDSRPCRSLTRCRTPIRSRQPPRRRRRGRYTSALVRIPTARGGRLALVALTQLSLVTVQVSDFAAMVAWYRFVFGLSIGWYGPNEFCTFTSEMVARASPSPPTMRIGYPDRPGTGWMPTFSVDTSDATIARLPRGRSCVRRRGGGGRGGYRLVRVGIRRVTIGLTPD